jgi:hypothetical protein
MRDPVFALTEGGTVGRPSTQRAFRHRVTVAICALKMDFKKISFPSKFIAHLLIRYLNARRQLSTDIVWIFHLTSGEEGGVAFTLKTLNLFRVNLFAIVHASLQIVVELIKLLLDVAHPLKWHVKFR